MAILLIKKCIIIIIKYSVKYSNLLIIKIIFIINFMLHVIMICLSVQIAGEGEGKGETRVCARE